jgi:hypothetical protein
MDSQDSERDLGAAKFSRMQTKFPNWYGATSRGCSCFRYRRIHSQDTVYHGVLYGLKIVTTHLYYYV